MSDNKMGPPNGDIFNLTMNLYALFGMVYCLSEDMRRELVYLLVLHDGPPPAKGQITHPQYGPLMEELQSGPLKTVVNKLRKHYGDEMPEFVDDAVEKRNFLAHNFWYDSMDMRVGQEKPDRVFQNLTGYHDLFKRVEEWAGEKVQKKEEELGVSIQFCIDLYKTGAYEPPAPVSRDELQQAKKMLKHTQKLVRVWTHPSIGMPLFELENGTFWRLGQYGLEISGSVDLSKGWQEREVLAPYLPSEISLRPEIIRPGCYDLPLKNGVALRIEAKNGTAIIRAVQR